MCLFFLKHLFGIILHMENIEFNPQDKEFQNLDERSTLPSSKSTMVGWLIKHSRGLIQDETQANYILLGIAGIFFILTVMVIINTSGLGPKKTTYKEDVPEEMRAAMPPEIYNSLPSRNK